MKIIFYRFSLMVISLILVTGSVANAGMPCCCTGELDNEASQADENHVPCHNEDLASKDVGDTENNKNSNSCEYCDCATCVKTSFYNTTLHYKEKEIQFSSIEFFEKENIHSHIYGSIYEPPKQIS